MKLKKYEKNPIIAPNPANAWENLVTCNPGVIYDDGRFYMLYRAAGDDKEHVIRLGLPSARTASTSAVSAIRRYSVPARTVPTEGASKIRAS